MPYVTTTRRRGRYNVCGMAGDDEFVWRPGTWAIVMSSNTATAAARAHAVARCGSGTVCDEPAVLTQAPGVTPALAGACGTRVSVTVWFTMSAPRRPAPVNDRGQVVYRLKHPFLDGVTDVVLAPNFKQRWRAHHRSPYPGGSHLTATHRLLAPTTGAEQAPPTLAPGPQWSLSSRIPNRAAMTVKPHPRPVERARPYRRDTPPTMRIAGFFPPILAAGLHGDRLNRHRSSAEILWEEAAGSFIGGTPSKSSAAWSFCEERREERQRDRS